MLEERDIAEQQGLPSPAWETLEDTHASYNRNMTKILTALAEQDGHMVVASHNVDSANLAKSLIKELQLPLDKVMFGQLKAFSDTLTFSLADEGYRVSKYLPYGPTEELIPYLVRRGQESKQVLREHLFVQEIKEEIGRRITLSRRM